MPSRATHSLVAVRISMCQTSFTTEHAQFSLSASAREHWLLWSRCVGILIIHVFAFLFEFPSCHRRKGTCAIWRSELPGARLAYFNLLSHGLQFRLLHPCDPVSGLISLGCTVPDLSRFKRFLFSQHQYQPHERFWTGLGSPHAMFSRGAQHTPFGGKILKSKNKIEREVQDEKFMRL